MKKKILAHVHGYYDKQLPLSKITRQLPIQLSMAFMSICFWSKQILVNMNAYSTHKSCGLSATSKYLVLHIWSYTSTSETHFFFLNEKLSDSSRSAKLIISEYLNTPAPSAAA